MDNRTIKVDGEEFVITEGSAKGELDVTNGKVTWHKATQRYRGEFNGWGSDADRVERAVEIAARRIIQTRKGISQSEAYEEMDKFLKG
jgi:hypothetical protein